MKNICAEGAVRAQRVLREYAEVVCSRQMGLFITYEDDDSKAARRNKTANTTKQFQICSDSVVPRNGTGAEERAE